MNAHVFNIARTFYFELRRLASIRRFLTSTATATLASAFALSRIDYCDSLLFGSTHDVTSHLQRMQNYAARVILRLPKSSNIPKHLQSLHWLPVKVKSIYKIACLYYHCHGSTAPSYVTDMLLKKPSHTRNTRSSSCTMPLLNRPAHSKATLGDRSFSFASSSDWNSIPNDVRCAPCCCRPHSTNVLPAESSTRNHVAASSLSPQVARKGSTLSGFVQRSRLEREVGRDLHSNKWEEV